MTNASSPVIPKELIDAIKTAKSVAVLTGAGISAESGIPTFRDSQTGLWSNYDPHQLATPQAFAQNPKLVMDWYRWRCQLIEKALPNPGHYALARLEEKIATFTLITRNVDGLHRLAGSHNVIELHGSINRLQCCSMTCKYQVEGWPEDPLPTCPACGELLRPAVVWFGEAMPAAALQSAIAAAHSAQVFIAVGTSGAVEPAASLPYEALRAGAMVVEVNPQLTPLSIYSKFAFPLPAGIFLPALFASGWE